MTYKEKKAVVWMVMAWFGGCVFGAGVATYLTF